MVMPIEAKAGTPHRLLQALAHSNHLTLSQIEIICSEFSKIKEGALIPFLSHHYQIDFRTIAQSCANYFALPYLDLHEIKPEAIPTQIHAEIMFKDRVILPIRKIDNILYVAIADPIDLNYLEKIKFQTGLAIQMCFCDYDQLTSFHHHYWSQQHYLNISQLSITENYDIQKNSPIINFVEQLINDAIFRKASDIHFEPMKDQYRIRMRIDGLLHEITTSPPELASHITSRLKILGEMDIAEKRLPQDGRFTFVSRQGQRDCRINSCPTLFGEKVVVRVLCVNENLLTIDELGWEQEDVDIYRKTLNNPQGLILVTGPTGSGKTGTLYAALNHLNNINKNISTIEDPIEIQLDGINQVNVHSKAGLDFTAALRSFLRQDPDIIMVGEIRDRETADMAIRAAQTGHLVLSTIHTNSAAETVTRLLNMGIAPYNIASSLNLIIAQRLLRKLCPHCKKIIKIPDELFPFNLPPNEFFQATGCVHCTKGYLGRTGVFELLPITHTFSEVILNKGTGREVSKAMLLQGRDTLWQAGIKKISTGQTNIDEVYRVIGSHDQTL